MESNSSLRNHPGCVCCAGESPASVHGNQSDVEDGPVGPKPSPKPRATLRSVSAPQARAAQHSSTAAERATLRSFSAPQAQATRHFSATAGPTTSLAGSPHISDSGARTGSSSSGGGHPQQPHHHHHHKNNKNQPSSPPLTYQFPATYVYPHSAPHIDFPLVDQSTPAPSTGPAGAIFRVAMVPECATTADLVAALAPAGSGTRLKARLECGGGTADVASGVDDAMGMAELRAVVLQLEIVDDPHGQYQRHPRVGGGGGGGGGTAKGGLEKANWKPPRVRSGQQHRQSSGSDSSSDTVVRNKQ